MSTLDSLTHHKEVLEQRHRLLDKVITDMYKQNSDDVLLHTMKKEKLQLRDDIEAMIIKLKDIK
jgi:uncharacterized protein YdcH (DUF465 family)|tara:strand:+ start:177 stop:368 length:192 start_codon:yes stop_codon:yes gene_type:complete